jgi:hypothetical protein
MRTIEVASAMWTRQAFQRQSMITPDAFCVVMIHYLLTQNNFSKRMLLKELNIVKEFKAKSVSKTR